MPIPNTSPERPDKPGPKVLFDWEDWLSYLTEFDAPEAEKLRFIEKLWDIVLAFVDLGWEVGSNAPDGEETMGQNVDLTTVLRAAVVYSEDQQQKEKEAS